MSSSHFSFPIQYFHLFSMFYSNFFSPHIADCNHKQNVFFLIQNDFTFNGVITQAIHSVSFKERMLLFTSHK